MFCDFSQGADGSNNREWSHQHPRHTSRFCSHLAGVASEMWA